MVSSSSGSGGTPPNAAGDNVLGVIRRQALADALGLIDLDEARALLAGRRGRHPLRDGVSGLRPGHQHDIDQIVVDRFLEILRGDVDDLHLVGRNAVVFQDHVEKIGAAVGAIDDADPLAGEFADLLDLAMSSAPLGCVGIRRRHDQDDHVLAQDRDHRPVRGQVEIAAHDRDIERRLAVDVGQRHCSRCYHRLDADRGALAAKLFGQLVDELDIPTALRPDRHFHDRRFGGQINRQSHKSGHNNETEDR